MLFDLSSTIKDSVLFHLIQWLTLGLLLSRANLWLKKYWCFLLSKVLGLPIIVESGRQVHLYIYSSAFFFFTLLLYLAIYFFRYRNKIGQEIILIFQSKTRFLLLCYCFFSFLKRLIYLCIICSNIHICK